MELTKDNFQGQLTQDLEFKLQEMKEQAKIMEMLSGLTRKIEGETTDKLGQIVARIQNFSQKKLKEEIEFFEEILNELKGTQADMKTTGLMS